LILIATAIFGLTSLVLLFGHRSNIGNAMGIFLFFATPIAMFAALLWIS
jgi:hypothetical protein